MSLGKNKRTEKANPPAAKVRVGLVTASIWENATDGGTMYNTTFERRYRDDKGDWHSSASYGPQDLLALAKAADMAHTKILEALNGENETEAE